MESRHKDLPTEASSTQKNKRSLTWGSGAMPEKKGSLYPLSPCLCPPPFPLGKTELMGTWLWLGPLFNQVFSRTSSWGGARPQIPINKAR